MPLHGAAQAWAAAGTGLVVNERLVNSPPELAEPLQGSLFGEVEEAAQDEELGEVGGAGCGVQHGRHRGSTGSAVGGARCKPARWAGPGSLPLPTTASTSALCSTR